MNIIKRCFTAIVSATMCAMVLVQTFGDNLLTLKPELVSYAVASENSTAENYADVVMNNYDMYSELLIPDEEIISPVGRTLGSISFMDLDFDGDLEFFIHFQDAGTGRISTASIFKIVDDSLQSIIKSEYFVDDIEGLYCDTNGEKFYLCYENSGGFGGVAYSLCKMYIKDGQIVNEELFSETNWNASASGDLYGTHEYYQNGEKIDVTEDEYHARIEQYKSSLTNLNLSYEKSQSFNSFNGMNDEEKREFLINSYNAFNYDGFEKQEDNIPDDNNKSWQELYADELRNYMNSNNYTDLAMFDLYDIDNDDIPELFISNNTGSADSCVSVYGYNNKEIIKLGEYSAYGCGGTLSYFTQNSILDACHGMHGKFYSELYSKNQNTMENIISLYSNIGDVGEDSDKLICQVNGENVSYEEYRKQVDKYLYGEIIRVGRKYTLDEETINSVLFNGGSEDDNNENQDKTYGDYTYLINENDEIVITKYTGSEENVEIPSEIDGKKVTTISGIEGPADLEYQRIGAFEENSDIKSVVIPDTVTKIEMNSFRACDNLQNVTISENIQTIEQNAFNDCNLSYIYLPESISDIGDCAFGYSGGSVINDFVIYGFNGTVAETYADNNGIRFIVSDRNTIRPLEIILDYEKVSDYSTLPNDDTVHIIGYPIYKITANIKNIDFKSAENVSVNLNCSGEITFLDCEKTQFCEIINRNEEVTIEWTVRINVSESYSAECDLIVKADNSLETNAHLTIPFDDTSTDRDNRFDFTKDTWKFTNSNIKPTYYFSKGYYIQKKYLEEFLKKLPNTAIQEIKDKLNSKWDGSCYGMSIVAILDKLDILDVTDYDKNATCVHDAKSPDKSDEISSLINAYYVSQRLQPVLNAHDEFNKLNTHEKLVKLIDSVEDVKSGGCPVAFSISWFNKDVSIKDKECDASGHEIVAYDIERSGKPYKVKNIITGANEDYSIRISLYDCSASGDKPIYMYITEDYNHWVIPELCGGQYPCQDYRESDTKFLNGRDKTLYYKGESDFSIITDPSVLDCFSWTDFTSNYKATLSVNNKTNLLIKWNNSTYKFMIDKLVDGAYNAGEEITAFFSNAGAEDPDGVSQANINYILPSLDGEYIISDPDGNATDIDYTLTYGNSMISAEASGAKSVTFNTDSVSVEADNSDYELAMTFNEGYYSMPWYTITASGNEANIVSMEQTDNGVILNSDNMESVTISANNTDETIELTFTADTENVLISNNENNLEVYEDINSDGIYETLVSTTAFDNEVDSDETNVTQDNNTNNLPTSPENNDNLKSDINTKSISTNSAPETGDNVIKIVSTLLLAVTVMIVFRKRK